MDTTALEIKFDANGQCNFCSEFVEKASPVIFGDPGDRQHKLDALLAQVRAAGRGKRYDVIVGVSGGVDSSWVLVKAVEMGLRPLAVHLDNGWNSELAQRNIANLVVRLNVDLYTHVINWREYRGLMECFFAADVIDIELLNDNALIALNFAQARKHGVQYLFTGSNIATEGMPLPSNWAWHKYDKRHIIGISRGFGGPKLKSFPAIGTTSLIRHVALERIKWVSILNYLDFNKSKAITNLTRDYGYAGYSHKHYESIFTRFFQGYLLPEKFNVDKRRVHFSTLIMTGQMTRDEAIASLAGIPYLDPRDLSSDRLYFLKKMGWSEEKLETYLSRPGKPHDSYPSEAVLFHRVLRLYRVLKLRLGRIPWD